MSMQTRKRSHHLAIADFARRFVCHRMRTLTLLCLNADSKASQLAGNSWFEVAISIYLQLDYTIHETFISDKVQGNNYLPAHAFFF